MSSRRATTGRVKEDGFRHPGPSRSALLPPVWPSYGFAQGRAAIPAGAGIVEPQVRTVVLHPLLGQTLRQYQIESLLGQGGMGVVYRGHDTKLQRPVALKLLTPGLTADPERRKRFLREARAAARISHPAIAQIYDVDEHEACGIGSLGEIRRFKSNLFLYQPKEEMDLF